MWQQQQPSKWSITKHSLWWQIVDLCAGFVCFLWKWWQQKTALISLLLFFVIFFFFFANASVHFTRVLEMYFRQFQDFGAMGWTTDASLTKLLYNSFICSLRAKFCIQLKLKYLSTHTYTHTQTHASVRTKISKTIFNRKEIRQTRC